MSKEKLEREHLNPTAKHIKKFWSNVPTTDSMSCWDWSGARFLNGYGKIYICGKTRKAHRVSYFLAKGFMPHPSEYVCHHCDNPSCVNPSHLFMGRAQDNSDDMVRKQRQACGERHMSRTHPEKLRRGSNHCWTGSDHSIGEKNPSAKITESQVRLIRHKYGKGGVVRIVDLAIEFGVSFSLISQIIRREVWSHIE